MKLDKWSMPIQGDRLAQFYEWLPFALILEPKPLYTKHDTRKLLFISAQLNRVRSLNLAKKKLIEHIQSNPQEYE